MEWLLVGGGGPELVLDQLEHFLDHGAHTLTHAARHILVRTHTIMRTCFHLDRAQGRRRCTSVAHGHAPCLELLHRYGARLELIQQQGFTALHYAVLYPYGSKSASPCLEELHRLGADMSAKNLQDQNVKQLARHRKNYKAALLVRLEKPRGIFWTPRAGSRWRCSACSSRPKTRRFSPAAGARAKRRAGTNDASHACTRAVCHAGCHSKQDANTL